MAAANSAALCASRQIRGGLACPRVESVAHDREKEEIRWQAIQPQRARPTQTKPRTNALRRCVQVSVGACACARVAGLGVLNMCPWAGTLRRSPSPSLSASPLRKHLVRRAGPHWRLSRCDPATFGLRRGLGRARTAGWSGWEVAHAAAFAFRRIGAAPTIILVGQTRWPRPCRQRKLRPVTLHVQATQAFNGHSLATMAQTEGEMGKMSGNCPSLPEIARHLSETELAELGPGAWPHQHSRRGHPEVHKRKSSHKHNLPTASPPQYSVRLWVRQEGRSESPLDVDSGVCP